MTLHEFNETFINNGKVTDIANPTAARYAFISNEEKQRLQELAELKVWAKGNETDIDAFYQMKAKFGMFFNPVLNGNKSNYFWAYAVQEDQPIKKVHTGIPKSTIETLVNALQDVTISSENEETQAMIEKICESEDFSLSQMLNQESRPDTLGMGDGAFKVVFDKTVSDTVIIQWYNAEDVEFIEDRKILKAIVFKDYYKYQNKKYIFEEIRWKEGANSKISYALFLVKNERSQEVEKVPLTEIPQTKDLEAEGLTIEGLNMILGVRSRFFKNDNFPARGKSIFEGKLCIADEMDMLATVESMTEMDSTPANYYPVDMISRRKKEGKLQFPKVFGKKFIKAPTSKNENGVENGEIKTEAPDLNFEKYYSALEKKIELFLSGILSPCSMGIGLTKRDNAEAQREKEKVTISTRNNIIKSEEKQLRKLIKICIALQYYLDNGTISLEKIKSLDFSVKYNTFASATFESMAQVLNPLFISGAISPKMLVNKLYGDSLSEEEKKHEIEEATKARESGNSESYLDTDIEGEDE